MARVLIAAGASGGHVYPGLATAVVLRDRGHEVVFAGGDRLEARVVPQAGFDFHALPVRRPPSVRIELLTPRGMRAMASIGLATLRAGRMLSRLRPDVVLGMGGYAAVPISLSAARARLPLVLHEQNAHLSFAQRLPLRWARVLALGLPLAERIEHERTVVVGNPVRSSITALFDLDGAARTSACAEARARLGLDPDATTVLVLGGSLGSGPLNETLPRLALPSETQVLHVAGPAHEATTRDAWEGSQASARVVGFIEHIEDAYIAADLAVCRSGASVVAELAIAGLASILVPLPTLARGDQEANARVLERAGGACVVLQTDPAFEERLGQQMLRLLRDVVARSVMARAVRTAARPDAAERLADIVEETARGEASSAS